MKDCSKRSLKINHVIVTVPCGTSSTRWQSLPSRRVRSTCVTHALLPRWQSLVIAGDRITDYVMCVLQSSITLLLRYACAYERKTIVLDHESPAIASIFSYFQYFPVRYAIVDGDRQGY